MDLRRPLGAIQLGQKALIGGNGFDELVVCSIPLLRKVTEPWDRGPRQRVRDQCTPVFTAVDGSWGVGGEDVGDALRGIDEQVRLLRTALRGAVGGHRWEALRG